MARFIHYFTRHQAHGDSVKMESRMFKETLTRISEGLRASRDGKLRWLQRGNGIANPLEVPTEVVNPHEKAVPNTSSSSSSSSSSSFHTPVKAMSESSQNKAASKGNVSFATHAVKSEECLSFLHDGFVELLKCREVSRCWVLIFAFKPWVHRRFYVGPIPMLTLSLRIDQLMNMATLGKNQTAFTFLVSQTGSQKSHVSSCSRQTTRAQDLL